MKVAKLTLMVLLTWVVDGPGAWAQEPTQAAAIPAFEKDVAPFLKQHCVHCHGPAKQAGKFRLDSLKGNLAGKAGEAAQWQAILERLATGEMPPKGEPRPNREAAERTVALL